MKQVKRVDFSHFRNNEHGQFHTVFKTELTRETPLKLGIIKFFQAYIDAVRAELAAIEVEQGSQHTLTVENSDLFREQMYRGFVFYIKSCLLSFDPAVQDAAHRIMRIIDQVGSIRQQDYNQESETLTSLINQLETNYMADIILCDGAERHTKVKEANNSFIADFGTRSDEVSARISGDVREARMPVDEIYKNIVSIINTMVLLNGEEDYSVFIDKINYQIDYYKNTINNRRSPSTDTTPAAE